MADSKSGCVSDCNFYERRSFVAMGLLRWLSLAKVLAQETELFSRLSDTVM